MTYWRQELESLGLGSTVQEMLAEPPAPPDAVPVVPRSSITLAVGEALLEEYRAAGMVRSVHDLLDFRRAILAAVEEAADQDCAAADKRESAQHWRGHPSCHGLPGAAA